MARITSYDNDTALHDEDLLTGSNYISVGRYNTRNFKLRDLAGYFANFTIQDGGTYNLATISQNITTNSNDISSNAQYSLNLAASFGTFDANGNLVALSEAFANNVFNVSSSTNYATSAQFTTLEATVNNNIANITSNASDITAVEASTTQNTTDIATNTGNISTVTTTANANATAISTLQTDLLSANTSITQNATNITTLDSSVTTINTTITGIQGDVSSNTTNITANASDITTLQNNLSTANTNISQNATDLTSLTSTVSTNTTNISNNDTDIASNTTNITTNASDITTLTNNLATTNANVTQNASDVTSLTTTVTNNTTNITANSGNITTNTSDISTNASNISTLTNDLATANTNITQNASDVTSLTSTVSTNTTDIATAEGNITTNTTNISTNASDITTLTNNLNTATTNISQNSSNITTLTSDVSTNSTNIGNNTTSISSNATNITTLTNNLSTTNANVTQNATDLTSLTTTVNGNTGDITANANSISSLTTTVNGNTADITTTQTIANRSDGFIKSSYGLTTTAGGVVTGMQIVAANNTTSTLSEVKFQADKFIVNSSSTNLTPFSISGSKIQFNGDITVSGTALIKGSVSSGDYIAAKFKNTDTTNNAGAGISLNSSSDYHHRILMTGGNTSSLPDQGTVFDLNASYQLGQDGQYSKQVLKMNGSGIIIPNQSANGITASANYSGGMNIIFNDNNGGRTGSSGRLHVNEYFKTFFLDVPGIQGSAGTYQDKVFVMRAHNGTGDQTVFDVDTNRKIKTVGNLEVGGNFNGQNGYFAQDLGIGFSSGNIGGKLDIVRSSAGIGIKNNYGSSVSSSTIGLLQYTSAAATSSGYHLVFQAAPPSGSDQNMLLCDLDGGLRNRYNEYGQYSDENIKENIVAATDKLEEVKQLQVKNFNLIGDDFKQIGLIAQDVEQIFPSLVKNTTTPDGTEVKSLKYSVLVPILIKAIQELEARVAQLETP